MHKEDLREQNKELNNRECEEKKLELDSTPQYITIGANYKCNADCSFCLGGDYPDFSLKVYKELFESRLKPVLEKAGHIGFCGYGEVLLMPEIIEFLDYLNHTLPGVQKVITTNGSPLKEKVCEKLAEGDYSILISLHASSADLHKKIVGIDAFDTIIKNIKRLVKYRDERKDSLHINLITVLSELNLKDLPDFIRMAAMLDVDRLTCNYLTVFTKDHVDISCFFNQEETNRILDECEKMVENYQRLTLVLPPRFGDEYPKQQLCRDPWEFFYAETEGWVLPCCNAGGHIASLYKQDFSDIWNSEGYLRLRKGFIDGEPYVWCKDCLKYNTARINDMRSHITARPETLEEITGYIKENEAKYGRPRGIYDS